MNSINVTHVRLVYNGNETAKEVYSILLKDINQMVYTLGDDLTMLRDTKLALMESLAVVESRERAIMMQRRPIYGNSTNRQ